VSFTGIYRHSIDSKGRLIVPSRLRDELEENTLSLIAMPDGCIGIWSGEAWRTLEQRLIEQRRSSDLATRRAIRRMGALTLQEQVDSQGRITIPPDLRDAVGVERDVVIVGQYDHAEIWSLERWEQEQQSLDEEDPDSVTSRVTF
jgi:MraZ protein